VVDKRFRLVIQRVPSRRGIAQRPDRLSSPEGGGAAGITPEARALYDKFEDLSFNSPFPWQQGPRRMGTDKNADVLWVGNSWGGSLTRIDTKTLATTIVPLPDPIAMQPYHLVVDKNHNVWGNLWTNDQIVKYDPGSSQAAR